eukprot:1016387-Rhodomonas_salina.1
MCWRCRYLRTRRDRIKCGYVFAGGVQSSCVEVLAVTISTNAVTDREWARWRRWWSHVEQCRGRAAGGSGERGNSDGSSVGSMAMRLVSSRAVWRFWLRP